MTLKRFLIGILVVWLVVSVYIAATSEPAPTPEPEPAVTSEPATPTEVIVFKTKTAGGASSGGTIHGTVDGTIELPLSSADKTYKVRAERGADVMGFFYRGNSTGTLHVKVYQDGLLIGDLKANENDGTANFGWTVKRAEDY